jgi:hypothetical protein
MDHFGPFSVAIAFWLFVAVASVAGIVADYKKRQAALSPLHTAIERGQQLDPALVERLMAPEGGSDINPVYLRIAGIITLSAGVGVGILAFFLAQVAPIALYPVLGGGVVTVCIGAGLMLSARAVEHAQAARQRTAGAVRDVRAS